MQANAIAANVKEDIRVNWGNADSLDSEPFRVWEFHETLDNVMYDVVEAIAHEVDGRFAEFGTQADVWWLDPDSPRMEPLIIIRVMDPQDETEFPWILQVGGVRFGTNSSYAVQAIARRWD